ncbi:MAG: hypothetical protein JXA82_18785 [Sedimentisphaerales bacterium]|nr:hypothetical protein [Sedimentisphaerales bacterium]
MSALTKVLIILLSFSSLFLCGAIVTYVGSANNYKDLYSGQLSQNQTLNDKVATLTAAAQEQRMMTEQKIQEYEKRIQVLTADNTQLSVDLNNALRESMGHQNRADKWQGLLESYGQTMANQELTIKSIQEKLDAARSQLIEDEKQLNQQTARVYELTVQMDALEAARRRAVEEKKVLEDKLNKIAAAAGAEPVKVSQGIVTPEKTQVTAAAESPSDVDLNALISEVYENLATISIGASDGVQKDMRFHVTRGDEFVCDVVITHVDADKAAGVVELQQKQVRVGDNASTKLM